MSQKIVQICSSAWHSGLGTQAMTLFALTDDGRVFSLELNKHRDVAGGWCALPSIPGNLSLSSMPTDA